MKGIKKVVLPIMIGLAIMIGMQSASHASVMSPTIRWDNYEYHSQFPT